MGFSLGSILNMPGQMMQLFMPSQQTGNPGIHDALFNPTPPPMPPAIAAQRGVSTQPSMVGAEASASIPPINFGTTPFDPAGEAAKSPAMDAMIDRLARLMAEQQLGESGDI